MILSFKIFIYYLFFTLTIGGSIAYAKDTIVFAPLPLEDTKTIHLKFMPIIKYLEKKMQKKIVLDYNQNYNEILKKFMTGKVDLAYLGPLPYLSLEKQYDHTQALVNFKNKKGTISYTCSFVTFVSNQTQIENIKNETIALTQPLSTCGYLFVHDILNQANVNIQNNWYRYVGRHDKVALSVIRDEFSYGGLKSDIAKQYKHLGLKELKVSKPIPSFVLVANSQTLSAQEIKEIKESLLTATHYDFKTWHNSLSYGLQSTELRDYTHLRSIIKNIPLPEKGNF